MLNEKQKQEIYDKFQDDPGLCDLVEFEIEYLMKDGYSFTDSLNEITNNYNFIAVESGEIFMEVSIYEND